MSYEHRELTRSLLRHYRQTSPEHVQAGLEWYDLAFTACERIGAYYGVSATGTAVALAHLSPRTRWAENLDLVEALLSGAPRPEKALSRQWRIASASLLAPDPLATFSRVARKTRSFARAITGDPQAVTVDIWMARAAGVEETSVRSRHGYNAVVDATRRGAGRVGIAPRDLQAIIWCHIRGAYI